METRKASETRKQTHARYETPGTVDGPFDVDRPWEEHPYRSDAACSLPWRADGVEAISVFLDPVLLDRATSICETVNGLAGAHGDLDGLIPALETFARAEGLSVSIHERPRDELSAGLVAVAFTLG